MLNKIYKNRLAITIISVILICMPLFAKNSHNDTSPKSNKKSPYGQCLNWSEVNLIIPKFAVFTVADLDSGQEFCVQRRGGYLHTDVQPLTAVDTAVMKKIYSGKWSWKRRAVTVQMDDGIKIAASMNGMPHGQGAIQGNQFNGHFCIHFAGSRTHGRKKVDLAHQIMIWKSSNTLDKQLKSLSAEKTIEVFFTAINQGDKKVSTKIIASQDEICWEKLKDIEYLRVNAIVKLNQDNNYQVKLSVKYTDAPGEINQNIIIRLNKKSSGWEIKPDFISELDR